MKKYFLLCALGLLAACSTGTAAPKPEAEAKPGIKLTLLPQSETAAGKPVTILAKLNRIDNGHRVTVDDLKEVHTQKFHLLVIDPTLTDYQHIHPEPTSTPGLWSFSFTPKLAGGYRAWADLTPKATGKQEFAATDIGAVRGGNIDKSESLQSVAGGYRFSLSFDERPAVGKASMGTIAIHDKNGKPVKTLEPVMGAYAHIVGFYSDLRRVVHTHPMGEEPSSAGSRGGPELMFHLEPSKPGFVKLFVQVKIGGKDIFVPFGVMVK